MTALNPTADLWITHLMSASPEGGTSSAASFDVGPDCCWFWCNVCCWLAC